MEAPNSTGDSTGVRLFMCKRVHESMGNSIKLVLARRFLEDCKLTKVANKRAAWVSRILRLAGGLIKFSTINLFFFSPSSSSSFFYFSSNNKLPDIPLKDFQ